jgi:hypothetical protein
MKTRVSKRLDYVMYYSMLDTEHQFVQLVKNLNNHALPISVTKS